MDIHRVQKVLDVDQFTPVGKHVLDLYLKTHVPRASLNS